MQRIIERFQSISSIRCSSIYASKYLLGNRPTKNDRFESNTSIFLRVRTASEFLVDEKIDSKNSRVERMRVSEMQSIARKGRRYGNYVIGNDKPKRFLI